MFSTVETVLSTVACINVEMSLEASTKDSGWAIRFALTSLYSAVYSFFFFNEVATAEGTGFCTPMANRT